MTSSRSLIAYFIPMSYEITTESDPEIGGIVIGAGTYLSGETVTVSAIPNDDYLFQNWTEGNTIVSESATYTFTNDHTRHLVAHFFFVEGIDENRDEIEIFPNPTTHNLYIKGHGIKQLTVYNTLGQLLENREAENQDMVMLNVSSLNAGVYVVRITLEQGVIIKTFIKKE